jgi:hypothetical protein
VDLTVQYRNESVEAASSAVPPRLGALAFGFMYSIWDVVDCLLAVRVVCSSVPLALLISEEGELFLFNVAA